METQISVTHSTFVLERTFAATPERVFAALSDPAAKRSWMTGGRGEGSGFEMDFQVGGRERSWSKMGENTPFPGVTLTNDTVYLDIVPGHRVVMAYTMTMGEHRFSASLATFELVPTDKGTNLIFTDQGAYFESSDGPQMREGGWRHLLSRLSEEVSR